MSKIRLNSANVIDVGNLHLHSITGSFSWPRIGTGCESWRFWLEPRHFGYLPPKQDPLQLIDTLHAARQKNAA